MDDQPAKKRRFRLLPTKKTKCPATMTVKSLKVFSEECYRAKAPNYEHGTWNMRTILRKLKADLHSPSPPTGMLRYIIAVSFTEDHNHSSVSTKLSGILHPRLREEIHTFVGNNICTTKSVKSHLEEVVLKMFEDGNRPKPDRLNRFYYPADHIIQYHKAKALCKMKKRKYYEDALEACVQTLQSEFPDDKFKCCTNGFEHNYAIEGEEPTCSTLLFCHQTKWQQDLLARYGNHVSLLDAAYKTIKFDLPLFFVVVKTNSGYCIVGTFVVQKESSVLISEALSQFKVWNPGWEPKYFLTDYSESGINALKETFPESTVYLSSFHREQTWHTWLSKTDNVSKEAMAPLKKLWHVIAASCSQEEYAVNLRNMYSNNCYQDNPNARHYFTREWLPITHMWVSAYHAQDFLSMVSSNNGVESQNKFLQHSYFKNTRDNSLTGLIRTIIKLYLPDMLQKYCVCNTTVPSDYNMFGGDLPEFLKNRPMSFIEHIKERFEIAQGYDSFHINDMGAGVFWVRRELESNESYRVDFHQATCVCSDFNVWGLPCKHMCAVFTHTEWGFETLPLWYRENPYLTIDTNYSAGIEPTTDINIMQELNLIGSFDNAPSSSQSITICEEVDPETINDQLPRTKEEELQNKKVRLELQENLYVMTGYSYLDFTADNLKKIRDMSEKLKETMKSLATTSNGELVATEVTAADVRLLQVKAVKKTYKKLPKRTRLKSKIKCVGGAGGSTQPNLNSALKHLNK